MAQTYLSIVIPAWNESANIKRGALDQVLKYLARQKFSWEVIVVNDGSSDDTLRLLEKYPVKVINNPHQGKAASVASGVSQSAGRIILFSDMDQATPISEFDKFIPKFKEGFDIVIGSRSGRKGAPIYRQILAYGMVILRTILLRLPYRDTQCGFKAFTKPTAQKLFVIFNKVHPVRPTTGGVTNPGFDVELLYLSRKLGFRTAEVTVNWEHQHGERVRFIKDAIAGTWELLLVRWRSLTNTYGLR